MNTTNTYDNVPVTDEQRNDDRRIVIAAVFAERDRAHDAVHRLHDEGFRETWLGVTRFDSADSYAVDEQGYDRAQAGEMRVESANWFMRFFGEGDESLHEALVRHGVADADARAAGSTASTLPEQSAILTVDGGNHPELAAQLIAGCGGRLITRGFGATGYGTTGRYEGSTIGTAVAGTAAAADDMRDAAHAPAYDTTGVGKYDTTTGTYDTSADLHETAADKYDTSAEKYGTSAGTYGAAADRFDSTAVRSYDTPAAEVDRPIAEDVTEAGTNGLSDAAAARAYTGTDGLSDEPAARASSGTNGFADDTAARAYTGTAGPASQTDLMPSTTGSSMTQAPATRTTSLLEDGADAADADSTSYDDYGRYRAGKPIDESTRLQLREERLRIDKSRVARGEATVGTQTVTESHEFDVPFTREELFVERRPVSDPPARGDAPPRADAIEVGSDQTVKVPLSEERVVVTKVPVVTEEVVVGKRQVEDTQHVSETTRKQQLAIDDVDRESATASRDARWS